MHFSLQLIKKTDPEQTLEEFLADWEGRMQKFNYDLQQERFRHVVNTRLPDLHLDLGLKEFFYTLYEHEQAQIKNEAHTMKVYLKVKIKTLAAEAKIIRAEQKKFRGTSDAFLGLYFHRIRDVRTEARHSLLAYGYLRGKDYRQIENSCDLLQNPPDWGNVFNMVCRFAPGVDQRIHNQKLEAWKDAALATPPTPKAERIKSVKYDGPTTGPQRDKTKSKNKRGFTKLPTTEATKAA